MKKVINLLGAILITGSVSAQWTYKVNDNGFDEPYKIAYTPENNSASLYLFKIDIDCFENFAYTLKKV